MMKLGILASHPIQYFAPLYRELARHCDLHVFYAHRPSAAQQGQEGFGHAFEWDVDLLGGYPHHFLCNSARQPSTSQFNGCDTPEISDRIRQGDFDAFLVSGWGLRCYWQAVWACLRTGTPVLVRGDSQLGTPRSRLKEAVKALLYPRLLRAFDGFCVVGARNRDYLLHYGVPAERLFFSPHAIDTTAFCAAAQSSSVAQTRVALGVPEDARLALFVGKLIPRKRVGDFLRGLEILTAKEEAIWGLVVGTGPEEASLRNQAATMKANIHFTGFRNQSELPALYAAADALVLPSDGSETWGLVVNEAFACGTPVVVSEAVGCAPDLVDGETGATFATRSPRAMAEALSRVFQQRKTTKVSAGIAAKNKLYSIGSAAKGILAAAETFARHRRQPKT